ncbi:DUF4345 family protein [Flavobacterium marginilacus]|uniref:DUF4345 family protein n=1 Tax=Flavobacterium marginilacus TaxID=3003256 RepID=UPI00248D5B5D|nr:DUF4345 family protein [Flavobacterium marginilacus]
MKKLINILVVVNIISILLLGFKNMFFPSDTVALYGVDLNSILAHNTFRGAISGTLVAIGFMLITGLLTKNKTWYQSALMLITVVFFGRIYSVIVDGWSSAILPPLVVEIISMTILYFASRQSKTSEKF